jgi:hypothetical protein
LHQAAETPCGKGALGSVCLLWANSPDGPFTQFCTVTSGAPPVDRTVTLLGASGCAYLRAVAEPGANHLVLHVVCLFLKSINPNLAPYGTGDASIFGAPSNLGIYGSAHVGNLGCIVSRTSDARILKLDLLATDHFHASAYPTCLLYNPYPTAMSVSFQVGQAPSDLYDAVSHRTVAKGVKGTAKVTLPSDAAMVLVEIPAGSDHRIKDGRLLVRGVTIGYKAAR